MVMNMLSLLLILISFPGLGTLIDGEPIINLPPKTIRLTKVDFSAVERTFYFKLHADSLNKFKVRSVPHYPSSLKKIIFASKMRNYDTA